jgi:hypothetical protein
LNPKQPRAWMGLGVVAHRYGDWTRAIDDYCASPQSKTDQEQCILKSSLTAGSNFSVALNGPTRGVPS